ncbi:hypothetical protein [Liquorilactobacillus hordei]|uniref:Uncharacterized protein n=1 Tax=Liquorilactobacillus hordei DSM 19519 TaxID=1423759 RepID=A0A0R1MJ89_9LACO|nr:hypothetical protein [Liquorilactobacillus hordei]KRL07990.1 hypothetical protein FC92_GL001061 [Liquorilactobacillus hordei DSM 19519]QYH51066.1 hypothetical protein G6O70_00440 [Liquorilactobacillus hordei DSM 19519]
MKKEEKIEIINGILASKGLSSEAKLEAIEIITNNSRFGDYLSGIQNHFKINNSDAVYLKDGSVTTGLMNNSK